MSDGPNALCAAPLGYCGIVQFPLNCLGQVVDLVTGDPVGWDDYAPAGGLSAVGTLAHSDSISLDPVRFDDVTTNEGKSFEFTVEGYTKWYEGERSLSPEVNTAAETVMGLIDSQVDATTELVQSSTPVTGSSRCSVCGPGNCLPRFAEIVIQPMYELLNGTRTVATRGGSALYQWQVHPSVRPIGGVNVLKTKDGADVVARTVQMRYEAGRNFWAAIKADPPSWFPSTDVIDVRTGDTINPLTSTLYETSPYVDFYTTAVPDGLLDFMTDNSCSVCGWLNPPAAE